MKKFLHFHNTEHVILNVTDFHTNSALNQICHIELLLGDSDLLKQKS